MEYQILEEDLDKAIKATNKNDYDICAVCIFSQTIARILKKSARTSQSGSDGMNLTVDMNYLYSENWNIVNPELNNLTRLFDEIAITTKDFSIIKSMLPFTFEFEFPDGVENANSSNNTKS